MAANGVDGTASDTDRDTQPRAAAADTAREGSAVRWVPAAASTAAASTAAATTPDARASGEWRETLGKPAETPMVFVPAPARARAPALDAAPAAQPPAGVFQPSATAADAPATAADAPADALEPGLVSRPVKRQRVAPTADNDNSNDYMNDGNNHDNSDNNGSGGLGSLAAPVPDALSMEPASDPVSEFQTRNLISDVMATIGQSDGADGASSFKRHGQTALAKADRSDEPLQLFEKAKEHNIIAVLDTGTGKTLVALLLMQHMLSLEPEDPETRRMAIFLVPTVPLVGQQAQYLRHNSPMRVGFMWGGMAMQDHGTVFWQKTLAQYDVMVMTPDILRGSLDHGFVSIERLCVIVVDECHHVRSNHPFNQVMRGHYVPCLPERRPKIFGITASPVVGKAQFVASIAELEASLCCTAITTTLSDDLVRFVSKPIERVEYYSNDGFFDPPALYNRIYNERRSLFTYLGQSMPDVLQICDDLGTWCAERALEVCVSEVALKLKRSAGIELTSREIGRIRALQDKAHGIEPSRVFDRPRNPYNATDILDTATNDSSAQTTETDGVDNTPIGETGVVVSAADATLAQDADMVAHGAMTAAQDLGTATAPESDDVSTASLATLDAPVETQTGADADAIAASSSADPFALPAVGIPIVSDDPEVQETFEYCHSLMSSSDWGLQSNPIQDALISPKINKLVDILLEFKDEPKFCGVVFVHQRMYAKVIHVLLKAHPKLPFVHPELLIGHGTSSAKSRVRNSVLRGSERMSIAQQTSAVAAFRDGRSNLLIATQVAEEGLDIKPCNVVIRFDMTQSLINYIQSRGRARHSLSQFIILANRHDLIEEQKLLGLKFEEEHMRSSLEESMANDRLAQERQESSMALADDEIFRVPSTGATLTIMNSMTILNRYTSSLPSDGYGSLVPEYSIVQLEGASCYCEILMPMQVRLDCRRFAGPNSWGHRLAKRRAAFGLAKKLHQLGELDEWLLAAGLFARDGDKAMRRVVKQKIGHNKATVTDYRLGIPLAFQGEWIDGADAWLSVIVMQIVDKQPQASITEPPPEPTSTDAPPGLAPPAASGTEDMNTTDASAADGQTDPVPKQPAKLPMSENHLPRRPVNGPLIIGLVTVGSCKPETEIMDMLIESSNYNVWTATLQQQFKLTTESIDLFRKFHYQLHAGMLRSPLTETMKPAVVCVPLCFPSTDPPTGPNSVDLTGDPHSLIDWDALRYCRDVDTSDLSRILDPNVAFSELEDIVLLDSVQYSRKYVIRGVEFGKQADTPLGLGSKFDTMRDYYTLRLECKEPINMSQVIIRAAGLAPPSQATKKQRPFGETHVLPQFCTVYPVKRQHLTEGLRIPIILRNIWHRLLAIDLKYGCGISSEPEIFKPSSAISAGDPPAAAAGTQSVEPFQAKLATIQMAITASSATQPFSYERLETLGDSFLKIHQTLHLFVKHPYQHEGWLTLARINIERNMSLYKQALQANLDKYIMTAPLSRRTWIPPSHDIALPQPMPEKTLADCVEALIGASLIDGGVTGAAHAVHRLLGSTYEIDWSVYAKEWRKVVEGSSAANRDEMLANAAMTQQQVGSNSIAFVEEKIGYTFKNKLLLCEALTHPSAITAGSCYQRLEFLGDAVLGFVVMRHLYQMDSPLSPGGLSTLRTELVCNQFLACVAMQLKLTSCMVHLDERLGEALAQFAQWLEIETGLRSSAPADNPEGQLFWNTTISAPKAAGDIYEAIIGAVFVDSSFSVNAAWAVVKTTMIDPWWKWFAPVIKKDVVTYQHPVGELRQVAYNVLKCGEVEYSFVPEGPVSIVTVNFHGRAIGQGIGATHRDAKKAASSTAIEYVHKNHEALIKLCDCLDIKAAMIKDLITAALAEEIDADAVAEDAALADGEIPGSGKAVDQEPSQPALETADVAQSAQDSSADVGMVVEATEPQDGLAAEARENASGVNSNPAS
ncbi:hypothetical protein BC831DRAFT_482028 [Entophlyctis helioformis]|nr:hypothetical protein BC831DRAFT_482028 [Entophlyctis helioformis]